MKPQVINLDQLEAKLISERIPNAPEKYHGAVMAPISGLIGAERLGYNLTIVPPGKCAFPAHNHYGNEEMFFILEGEGQLRIGNTYSPIRAGDFIACPPGGPETAHQIINTSETLTLRYLAVSTMQSPDLFHYPDSGKTGASHILERDENGYPIALRIRNRTEHNLDYWEGE